MGQLEFIDQRIVLVLAVRSDFAECAAHFFQRYAPVAIGRHRVRRRLLLLLAPGGVHLVRADALDVGIAWLKCWR